MYDLIGTRQDVYQERIGGSFKSDFTDEVVATFDNEKDAKAYIRKSKLKHRQQVSYSSDIVFKKRSLLRNYVDARVSEHYVEPDPPHNPEI